MITTRLLSLFTVALLLFPVPVAAQTIEELIKRIEAQDEKIRTLEKRLAEQSNASPTPKTSGEMTSPVNQVATVKKPEASDASSTVSVGYDKGFKLTDKSDNKSYELKMNGRAQLRHAAFSRRSRTYTFDDDTSGEQSNRNDFEIERGRIEFSGHIADPKLQFYVNLDMDTDDSHDVKAHDLWVNYAFNEAFNLHAGKAFVPGSREWLDGSTTTHLADRSLANQYFRPDRSLGVWASGQPLKDLNYRTMLSNGFATSDLEAEDIDTNFTYATSLWGDILGSYGKGRADLEYHEKAALRLGGSFTYSAIDETGGEPLGEADYVRLSNGQRLDGEGTYAPGLTVDEYDIFLYALDLSGKYRGFSFNSEVYLRSITAIDGNAPVDDDSFTDRGGYIDVGYFVVPKLIEPVVRYSIIDGTRSNSHEVAAGVNWFVNGTHLNKITFDVARIEDSPTSASSPDYRVGDTGYLFRTQWQVGF